MTKTIGILLGVLGTLIVIGAGLFAFNNPLALLGLLATLWVVLGMLRDGTDVLLRGFLILLVGIFLVLAVYFVGLIALLGLVVVMLFAPRPW